MQLLLFFLIVLLSVAICALGGFWFFRAAEERKQIIGPPQITRGTAGHDHWEGAVRVSRDRA